LSVEPQVPSETQQGWGLAIEPINCSLRRNLFHWQGGSGIQKNVSLRNLGDGFHYVSRGRTSKDL